MSSANKAKGSRFEGDLCDALQANGIRAKRLPRTGSKDIGDAAFPLKVEGTVVLEAKNRRKLELAVFLDEAAVESANYESKYPAEAPAFGCAVVKRRQHNAESSYVVFELREFIDLLKQVGAV